MDASKAGQSGLSFQYEVRACQSYSFGDAKAEEAFMRGDSEETINSCLIFTIGDNRLGIGNYGRN